jgi:flagellar hook protein FlgE
MSSFSIPLTGLKTSSEALNTIANNISNMNTTAFKSQSVMFSDLFYQQIGATGSGNPLQVGAGTQVAATNTNFSQGGVNSTGNASDLYINGSGFFVLQGSDGGTELTRDGNFTTSGGYLETQDGQSVMGYPATNGVVNTSAQLAPIHLPVGQVEIAKATTTMSMTANLNAADTVGTTVQGQVPIYDSLGTGHEATVYFTKTANNTWSYNFSLDPKTLSDTSSATTRTLAPAAGAGTTSFAFDAGGTVDPSTSFTINDGSTTVTAPTAISGESLSTYLTSLQQTLSNQGSTATASVTGGTTLTIAGGAVTGKVVEGGITTYAYNLDAGDTIDPSSNLTITGANSSGNSVTTQVPPLTPGENLNSYASALTAMLGTVGIQGVQISANGTGLSISGPGISLGGNLIESAVGTATGNAAGTLTFDASGNLISPSSNVAGIQLGGLSDGAANLGLTWNLYGSGGIGEITQSTTDTAASGNPVTGTTQDGYASGTYQGFAVDASGVVSANFSNGKTQAVGQVVLANVANTQGLTILAGNNYATTTASGNATTGLAGTGGLGTLEEDTLEGSNVDISTQFSNLIVEQQAFDASSKAITTFDTISQDTLNMIH